MDIRDISTTSEKYKEKSASSNYQENEGGVITRKITRITEGGVHTYNGHFHTIFESFYSVQQDHMLCLIRFFFGSEKYMPSAKQNDHKEGLEGVGYFTITTQIQPKNILAKLETRKCGNHNQACFLHLMKKIKCSLFFSSCPIFLCIFLNLPIPNCIFLLEVNGSFAIDFDRSRSRAKAMFDFICLTFYF